MTGPGPVGTVHGAPFDRLNRQVYERRSRLGRGQPRPAVWTGRGALCVALFVDAPVSGSKGPAEAGQGSRMKLVVNTYLSFLKDVDLALGAANGTSLPMLAALSRQWHTAVEAGYGRNDVSAARLALGDPASRPSPQQLGR